MKNIPMWAVTAAVTALLMAMIRSRKGTRWKRTKGNVTNGEVVAGKVKGQDCYWIDITFEFADHSGRNWTKKQRMSFWCLSMEEARRTIEYAKQYPAEIRYNEKEPLDCDINIATDAE